MVRKIHTIDVKVWIGSDVSEFHAFPDFTLEVSRVLSQRQDPSLFLRHKRLPHDSLRRSDNHLFQTGKEGCALFSHLLIDSFYILFSTLKDRRGPYTHRIGAGMGRAIVGGNGSLNAREFHESVNGFVYPELSGLVTKNNFSML